jgi:signal transduction histidine kinase
MGSIFKSAPGMKQHLPSPLSKSDDDTNGVQQHPHGTLMQDQEKLAHQLAEKISQIIAGFSTPSGMLREIAQALGETFDTDSCCLVTVSDDESTEVITGNWCAPEYLKTVNPDQIFSAEQLDLPLVQSAAEPLRIEDISLIEDSLIIGCQNLPLPIKTVLAIPTRFAGKTNGVVSLIRAQPYDWDQSEKELLKYLESLCAIAFSQVAQLQLLNSQQQFFQTCTQHQSLITQLSILSRTNLELNQMLQLVITATAEALDADRGLLILLKYTDPLFRIRPRKHVPKAKATVIGEWSKPGVDLGFEPLNELQKSFLISDCGLSQRAFSEPSKPTIINAVTDFRDHTAAAEAFMLNKLPTVLLMPLETQGRILGFVVLQMTKPRRWQPPELNITALVCAQVSNSIIQSQTLRQVQTLVDERTAQLQRSLEVQAKLYEKTRQYVEQLRRLNELKDEFLSNMSDRLRYPLTNMRMALKNLRQPDLPNDRQTRYLDILESECSKEINLINDLLTIQKLESHPQPPDLEKIDLNQRIQQAAAAFATKMTDKNLSITLDLPAETLILETEIESFDRILQELLTNTTKYSQAATTVAIEVNHEVSEQIDQVIIKVINTGTGISQEEATYIFDKFYRGKGRWTPGTGLGLALVKSLVQHLNGKISVESTPIEDSDFSEVCFTITLPQFPTDIDEMEMK